MRASESLNLNTFINIPDPTTGAAIPLLRMSANLNVDNNSYNIQTMAINIEKIQENQEYVNTEVQAFKALIAQRASELGITYFA